MAPKDVVLGAERSKMREVWFAARKPKECLFLVQFIETRSGL
jgi:hypothetical protein